MDKQKKQLIVLVVLVIGMGLVGAWQFKLFDGGETPPKTVAGTDQPPGGEPDAGAPNPGANLPPDPVGGGVPDANKPDAQLEMPKFEDFEDAKPESRDWQWPVPIWERGKKEPETANIEDRWPADPFKVLNIDVVDPNRHAEIQSIIDAWKLVGITRAKQPIYRDGVENGEPVRIRSYEQVFEAWFEGMTRTFKEGDRLSGTRFKIQKIFRSSDPSIGEGVSLIGDTGATLILRLAPPNRYDADFTDK